MDKVFLPSPALLLANQRLLQLRQQTQGKRREERGGRDEEQGVREEEHGQLETGHGEPETIKLYPGLVVGILQQRMAGAGRVWFLLRHLDKNGRGWLSVEVVRGCLTDKTSPHYLCGWRQLRNVLQAGQGVFWQRDETGIWLRSVAKTAVSLGVERLTGQPVLVPLKVLLSGLDEVKAHFYASFHSGRKQPAPISRQVLQTVTGVPARTQREYEKLAGIYPQRNIGVGELYTAEKEQQRAWTQGTAVFDFVDYHGQQGPVRQRYVAWHLPNSYSGCHQLCSKGRQKKINREIILVNQKVRGKGFQGCQLFHPNGAAAGRAYNRHDGQDHYWQQGRSRQDGVSIWFVLSASVTRPRK